MTVCKRTILSLSIPLLAGLTACAPDLFPDLPDDDTCYNRVQEIIQITNETAINTPELQMQLNPEPYLNILCARGKLRKATISFETKEQLAGFEKLARTTPELIFQQGTNATAGFRNYEGRYFAIRTIYFWSKDTPKILAMLRRVYGEKITGKSIFRN